MVPADFKGWNDWNPWNLWGYYEVKTDETRTGREAGCEAHTVPPL
jgi:hypothetical protein